MIYPLNQTIENFMATLVDEETGEVKCTEEEMIEAIANFEMEFDEKIKALRNSYMETMLKAKRVAAEAEVLRQEAANAQKRANSLTNKGDRLKKFLAYLTAGEPYDKDGVRITYRKSKECVLDDDFVEWAKKNAQGYLDFKPRKLEVKQALLNGAQIDHAHIEERSNIVIR